MNEKKYMVMAWLICGLGALYYSYEYLLRISPSVMEPALREHFNLSATGFGLLSAFYYYAYVPLQIPVGVLLDRYGPRLLLTLACMVCVIGTFIFCGTQLFWVAAVGRFLVGFGSAFAFVGVLKLATIWLPEDKLAMVSGMASALGTIGAMLGDNLLGYMVIKLGWRETVNYTAIFGIGLIFVLWYGIRDRHRNQRQSGTVENFRQSMTDLGIIARNKQIWINGMYGCLVYLPATVFAELWGIPYLKNAHGLSLEAADLANSLLFLGFTIGAPLFGLLSDKLKRRKLPMVIGAVGAAIVMMMVLYMPGLTEVGIDSLMFVLGLLYSAQCIVFAVGRELSPNEAAGTAIAMTNMIVMLGAMFLQPLVGRLLDFSLSVHTHAAGLDALSTDKLAQLYTASDYQFALSIIPLGIVLAAILTFFLDETHADANH
ncbi:MFS transporter [Legionella taurinensis]|uniref:Lysosomal dipeptide transporter MFSD1 n=1 Tax=Legionella taurinensis TaxID=70611 RepID=A0A3A5LGP9_9GAMM|nr:MFS transporter [Legionella taurinensis]MDX1838755.1 MFS transporter [Legionella taurinensis]PUT38620.1 MFS transporter [Legionella taurinensis]PUT39819.1 MFS transporter [Legionella taurinensis]PUT41811.1 MFS transporter [Legionella taurinensis]PUT45306.1 MFS transporter [Legionella taurinensis]